jgi:hypothetical protein
LNGVWTAVSTLAGGVRGTNSNYTDAFGTNAGFNDPVGVAVDASGNLYVADYMNQRIRKVTADGGTRIDLQVVVRVCFLDHYGSCCFSVNEWAFMY